MNPSNKEKKESIIEELLWGILGLYTGDITSKIGWALLSLLIGTIVITCPIFDNGIALRKSLAQYAIGSALILLAIGLVISWIRKRRQHKI